MSRGATADTERTKVGEGKRLLHLRLRVEDLTEKAKGLLLTDISGEEYEDIRHSVDACRKFDLFNRADQLVLLLDGKRLAANNERHAARIDATQLLQCMFDAGHLRKATRLDLLVAKCDILDGEPARRFVESLENEIRDRYADIVDLLRIHRVAARPSRITSDYQLGHGLDVVLPAWLNRRVKSIDLSKRVVPNSALCEFDQFLERQCPSSVVK